ncbi:hypothetical protein BDV25DRAFT_157015, partial [Aspergillus avenaceus]
MTDTNSPVPFPNTIPNPISNPIPNTNTNSPAMPESTTTSAAATPHTTTDPGMRPGGAPARVYMNEKIVPYLLEGMKSVTKEQPANPLRALGEFLIQKSIEVEGGKTP